MSNGKTRGVDRRLGGLCAWALMLFAWAMCWGCSGSGPSESSRNGAWIRANEGQIFRDCQPILDALSAYQGTHGRYPAEDDPVFAPHAKWLDEQRWNWTYFLEADLSAFCLGIGDYDMDGVSLVWCSMHGGWARNSKEGGVVPLEEGGKTGAAGK